MPPSAAREGVATPPAKRPLGTTRTSESSIHARYARHPFHAPGCIGARGSRECGRTVSGIQLVRAGPPPRATAARGRHGPREKATEGAKMNTASSRGSRVNDTAPAIVRLAQGSLMAGHGAQKLFGSFGGPGLEGTSGFMEMIGMRPGRPWADLAGLSEFGGGVLTALGLLNPLGPLGVIGAMSMA